MISLLVPWASCSLVTGIQSDRFGGCYHLLKCTVLHSPACVCATMCFKGARGFLVTKNDYRLPAFVLFGKLFLHSVLLVCNRSETSLKPKEPNVQVAFLFGFFFIPGNGDGSGHVKGRPLHMWGFLGYSWVSEKSSFNANGYIAS